MENIAENTKLEIETHTVPLIKSICQALNVELNNVISSQTLELALKNIEELRQTIEKQTNKIQKLEKDLLLLKQKIEEPNSDLDVSKITQEINSKDKVLVISNLGVISHQIKKLVSKNEITVTIAQNVVEGINELKNEKTYSYIVYDTQLPTEQDFATIQGLKKAIEICHSNTTLIVLIKPIRDKKLKQQLFTEGANKVLEKSESWHQQLLKELGIEQE